MGMSGRSDPDPTCLQTTRALLKDEFDPVNLASLQA